jgi:hypothetical protein
MAQFLLDQNSHDSANPDDGVKTGVQHQRAPLLEPEPRFRFVMPFDADPSRDPHGAELEHEPAPALAECQLTIN